MRIRIGVWAGALLLAAAVAGCGGGDDDGLQAGDVSPAKYRSQADKICRNGSAKLRRDVVERFDQLGLRPTQRPSDEQLAEIVREVTIPVVEGELAQLRELEAPAKDVDQIEEVYDTLEEEIGELEDDPAEVFKRGSDPFPGASRLADEYGFDDCVP
jgi:hypothetical protein